MRLVDSPACIVVGDGELSPQMVQMLANGAGSARCEADA